MSRAPPLSLLRLTPLLLQLIIVPSRAQIEAPDCLPAAIKIGIGFVACFFHQDPPMNLAVLCRPTIASIRPLARRLLTSQQNATTDVRFFHLP
jgi:hypothetical protein